MTPEIKAAREALCESCPTPCMQRPDTGDHRTQCPLPFPRWMRAPKPKTARMLAALERSSREEPKTEERHPPAQYTGPRVVRARRGFGLEVLLTADNPPQAWGTIPDLPLGLQLFPDSGLIVGAPQRAGVSMHLVTCDGRIIPGATLQITVEDKQDAPAVASTDAPVVVPVIEPVLDVNTFFDLEKPCPLPGCDQLRLLYKADVSKLGDGCSGCAAASLKRKYIDAYRNLLATSG